MLRRFSGDPHRGKNVWLYLLAKQYLPGDHCPDHKNNLKIN